MRVLALAALAMVAAPTAAYADQLIFNGDFEAGPRDPSGVLSLGAGSDQLPGWTIGLGGVDVVSPPLWNGAEGSQASIDMSLLSAGALSQIVQLSDATRYRLQFQLAANPEPTPPGKTLQVTIGSGATAITRQFGAASSGVTNAVTWTAHEIEFDGSDALTAIGFQSLDDTPYGPLLDSVSLVPIGQIMRTVELTADGDPSLDIFLTSRGTYWPYGNSVPPTGPHTVSPLPATIQVATATTPLTPPEAGELTYSPSTHRVTAIRGGFSGLYPYVTASNALGRAAGAGTPFLDLDGDEFLDWSTGVPTLVDGTRTVHGTISFAGGSSYTGAFTMKATTGLVPMSLASVPEPATWTLLLAGFGAVGATIRRRPRALAAAAA